MVRAVYYYFPLVIIAAVWELVSQTGLVSQSLLPSFSATMQALWYLLTEGGLVFHIGISFFREFTGLAAAVIVGLLIGIGMARSAWTRDLLEPLVSATYPLPKSALIPMLLLWFGIGHMSKIAAIFLGCLLPVVLSAFNGARGVQPQIIWSARSLGTSEWGVLWKVIFMAALPEILSGIRIALALSFVLLISAEMLIARAGLGYLIGFLGSGGEYDAMFAVIVAVTFIGFAMDQLFRLFTDWVLRWREFG